MQLKALKISSILTQKYDVINNLFRFKTLTEYIKFYELFWYVYSIPIINRYQVVNMTK